MKHSSMANYLFDERESDPILCSGQQSVRCVMRLIKFVSRKNRTFKENTSSKQEEKTMRGLLLYELFRDPTCAPFFISVCIQ
jgi:hypothetical protein